MATTAASASNAYSFVEVRFNVNGNNGVYQLGKPYGVQKRVEVAHTHKPAIMFFHLYLVSNT
eukprot:14681897-Ditylum_brightwellii.AAC.1